jgi:hypothetical protein
MVWGLWYRDICRIYWETEISKWQLGGGVSDLIHEYWFGLPYEMEVVQAGKSESGASAVGSSRASLGMKYLWALTVFCRSISYETRV